MLGELDYTNAKGAFFSAFVRTFSEGDGDILLDLVMQGSSGKRLEEDGKNIAFCVSNDYLEVNVWQDAI